MKTTKLMLTFACLSGLMLGPGQADVPATSSAGVTKLKNHGAGNQSSKPGGLAKPASRPKKPDDQQPPAVRNPGVGTVAQASTVTAARAATGPTGSLGSGSQTPSASPPPPPGAGAATLAAPGALPAKMPGHSPVSTQTVATGKVPAGSGTMVPLLGVAVHSRSVGTASLGGPASGSVKRSLAVINGRDLNLKHKF